MPLQYGEPRNPLKFVGVPRTRQQISAVTGPKFTAQFTARHSSSGRQPNFAALNRGRHLYSAGRPSRWALAHILVDKLFVSMIG